MSEQYKDTELGKIPVDWDIVNIFDICANEKNAIKPGPFGSSLKKEFYVTNGYKVYGQEQVISYDFEVGNYYIDEKKYQELKDFTIKSKDLLISLVGTYGQVAIVPENIEPGIINPRLMKITFNHEIANVKFYKYFMMSSLCINQLKKFSHGGTMDIINASVIKKLKFILPPFPEQQKIADIFSTVDQQIEQTDTLIEKTKELKKGLMQKLLTKGIGHTEFKKTEVGEIPVEWECISLKQVFRVSSGRFLPQKDIKEGNYAIYGGNGLIGYHKEYLYKYPQIVIGRVGAKCGCVCLTKPKSWITDNALIVTDKIKEFNDNFMVYLLEFCNLNKYANQSAQPVISGQKIYQLKVALPPLEEQEKIAEFLSSVDEKIGQYESKKHHLQSLKKGLMQKLLTGKIRVNVSEEDSLCQQDLATKSL